MIKLFLLLLIFVLVSCKSHEFESLPKDTQNLINSCQACHAGGTNPNKGPSLDGMEKWYIMEQFQNFKEGKRGQNSGSPGALMSSAAQAVSQDDIEEIASWFSNQEVKKIKSSFKGNIRTGEVKYEENCKGCHSSAIGRFFTDSPEIEHLESDYIFDQLKQFRDGKRLFFESTKHKEKMIVVARRFNDEQLKDIVAYLESLK